ncbi:uncharacterized protein PODANS_4_610 [Podospora anserina S mat+]|uniref:U4/U6 snRNA-associated-splicing factor PRP24 n=1 Tax=Podospora anserina (strain S / ATCC MYA-4624 / DSM 980 / FGSC 10383) TaxID=515849 RepID=B2ADB3_PODAN|nr:uncharacterized protein PODANS_4_610 [Podospora anserina S mat+]CAP61428.1 unnamed protein product [Podospora anserina S mat+]CDP27782.1 Putative protein of unknown function [Podospora anserina S mat+]
MASPVGEDNWVDYVDHQLREATDLEARVRVIESFNDAVSAEPGSIKVWMAYCEYFWSLYNDCQPVSDAGWSPEEQEVGRSIFTIDAALNLWQRGYEAVQYRLSDSNELWDRWISLEMELLRRTVTEAGVRRITQLFRNRLTVPHATWDRTSQMFSTFLSEYNRQAYESEMEQITRSAKNAKRLYALRDPFETKLSLAVKSGDTAAVRAEMLEYIDWEIKQHKGKRDALDNFKICLGLFSRALTGVLASDDTTWLNFITLVSTSQSDLKAGRARVSANLVPNMLDVLRRAVHHIPWAGPVWARYILAAEEAALTFADVERIKHAATNSPQLDRDGMTGVLDMYSAWCGYLKRTAMNPKASEEAVDVAEVGLSSALEDVKHWGQRKYGENYQGDPDYRLEKILIQFLTEKKEDIEGARAIWDELSQIPLHANSYDFWLNWYLWEMVVFTAHRAKLRSPTPNTQAQGLLVPSLATRVFTRALKVRTLDWPERILQVYLKHCNDYELAETLREAHDTIYKTRKGVEKRREREARQAAEAARQAAAAREQAAPADRSEDVPMTDASGSASPGSKRKREPTPAEDDAANKRPRSETNGDDVKRDREHNTVFLRNLPADATQTKIKQFFRDYGHVNNIDLKKGDDDAVALVEFRHSDDARAALIRDGKPFGDRIIQVTPAIDCTLFVTNYPPDADEEYLRNLFKAHGEIHSIRFPSLKENVKRRFCYLTFRERASAEAALKLDGKALGGRCRLVVKISDPAHKQHRQGAQEEERELHVINIPRTMKEDEVEGHFTKAGKVVSVRIPHLGTAFVVMQTKEEAQEAIKLLDKAMFGQHPIKVEPSMPKGTKKKTATAWGGAEDAESPASTAAESTVSSGGGGGAARDRKVVILGVPDTMNEARVGNLLKPAGEFVKLTLHARHGGAIVEYKDAASAGKAQLVIDGLEVEAGQKLRVGTTEELFQSKGEKKVAGSDPCARPEPEKQRKKPPTAAQLMPPPPSINRPQVLGRSKPKMGMGTGAPGLGVRTNGVALVGPKKSNADFRSLFLGGGNNGGGGEGGGKVEEEKTKENGSKE